MNDHPSRRSCRLVLVAIAALVALAVVPAAGAHTRLMTTEPANDAVLEQSPRFVLLRFDEPVETAFGAIRVYDDRAHRVDSGKVEQPSGKEVRVQLAQHLARGTYTVTWRVVSVDGHPVSGAFVFHVGAPECEPGRRGGAGARRWDATIGDDRVLDRPGTRLPAPAPRGRRDVAAASPVSSERPPRYGRGCRACLRPAPVRSP